MKKRGEEFWAQVRRAYENGEGGYEALAERFGVCRQAVGLHRKKEGWVKNATKPQPMPDMQAVADKLSAAAMRALDKLGQAEGEPDVKTIRELAALMKELNQLMRISGESESGEATVQVQWGEEAEPWSE